MKTNLEIKVTKNIIYPLCVCTVLLLSAWGSLSSSAYGQDSASKTAKAIDAGHMDVSYDVTVKDVNFLIARDTKIL